MERTPKVGDKTLNSSQVKVIAEIINNPNIKAGIRNCLYSLVKR